jgi:hypothetical protein
MKDTMSADARAATAWRYGKVPIPGEATLELPAGVVRVYHEVDEGASGGLIHPLPSLVIRVQDAAGADLPFEPRSMLIQRTVRNLDGSGRSYAGRIEVAQAGPHRVIAELDGQPVVACRLCLGD